MDKVIRTDYHRNDTIEMTAVEISIDKYTNETEYFVDYLEDGRDNTATEIFKTEYAAHEFMSNEKEWRRVFGK